MRDLERGFLYDIICSEREKNCRGRPLKKIFLVFGAFVCITYPSFANIVTVDNTTVPPTITTVPNANCDQNTLGVASGGASLQEVWQANTINLAWNANGGTANNGSSYAGVVTNASTTCTYDDVITLPPAPVRVGYTFAGWDVTGVTTPS